MHRLKATRKKKVENSSYISITICILYLHTYEYYGYIKQHHTDRGAESEVESESRRSEKRERESESFRKIHSHELNFTMMSPVGCLLSLTGRRSLCPFEARTPYFLHLTKMTGSNEFQPIKSLLELLRTSKTLGCSPHLSPAQKAVSVVAINLEIYLLREGRARPTILSLSVQGSRHIIFQTLFITCLR